MKAELVVFWDTVSRILIIAIIKGRPWSATNNSIWAIIKHLKDFPKHKLLERTDEQPDFQ